jgi:hypothetical protein
MGYTGDSVVSAGEAMQFTVTVLIAALVASGLSLTAYYGVRAAWLRASAARRRHRAEALLRADIERGLAEIERFAADQAEKACRKDPPDTAGGGAGGTGGGEAG